MKNIILTLFILLFCSCKETIEVDNFKSVTIKFKVNSSNDILFDSSIISLRSNPDWSVSGVAIKDGILELKVFPGYYTITTQSYNNSVFYTERKNYMIFSDETKYIEFNPFNRIGSIKLILKNSKQLPLQNIYVSLLSKRLLGSKTFNELKSTEYLTSKTDQNGNVIFNNIPLEYYFGAMCYIDENKYTFISDMLSASEFVFTYNVNL